jgi:diguanylate cyclase (GGDEF)-like protein
MTPEPIIDIISNCRKIDGIAFNIYKSFHFHTEDPELKAFWQEMAMDEQKHIRYWKELLELARRDSLPPVFNDPAAIKGEFEQILAQAAELKQYIRKWPGERFSLLIAYRLEFFMLHRAFTSLFRCIDNVLETETPLVEYENHIIKFITALDRYKGESLEQQLLSETITKLWYDNKRLILLTSYDPLTMLLNRAGLFDAMRILSHVAMRNNFTVGIMMIDIDHFKKVNDTYGHQEGDRVLKAVAAVIKSGLRRSDLVGRYGGEEVLVFVSHTNLDNMITVGEKIRAAVEQKTRKILPVTVSIGVSAGMFKIDPKTELHKLIKIADDNLYTAKNRGRNIVVNSGKGK